MNKLLPSSPVHFLSIRYRLSRTGYFLIKRKKKLRASFQLQPKYLHFLSCPPTLPNTDTLIGTVITQVTGNDVDSGPALSYTLHLDTSSQGMFGIHRYGGGVSLTGPLDYEERTWYTLTVRSSDSKHQSEANLTVLVDDVNDNVPTFTQDFYQVQPPSLACILHLSKHRHICSIAVVSVKNMDVFTLCCTH